MKNLFVFVAPLFLLAMFFAGCGVGNSANSVNVAFLNTDDITLRIGTADSSYEVAYAPLSSDIDMNYCVIDYDRNVIRYNVETGQIKAVGEGTTQLTAYFNKKLSVINITVEAAVYCTWLHTQETGNVYMGSNPQLFATTNSYYNMGLAYESLNPDILDVDSTGMLHPKKEGNATIKIIAKTAPRADGTYQTTFVTKNIQVSKERESLEIEILDEQLNPLDFTYDEMGVKTYDLFSAYPKAITKYVLKVSSDSGFTNSFLKDGEDVTSDSVWAWDKNTTVETIDDGNVFYRKFYPTRFGQIGYMQQCLIDSAMGYTRQVESNYLRINTYRLTKQDDVDVEVFDDFNQTTASEQDNGKYALTEQNYNKFVKVTVNSECKDNWSFVTENIECNQIEDCLLVGLSSEVGVGKLILKANDGSGTTKVVYFYNDLYQETIQVSTTDLQSHLDNDGLGCAHIDYTVYMASGAVPNIQACVVEFYDEDLQKISKPNYIYYYDVSYGSVSISTETTCHFYIKLISKLGYVSPMIEITILP